MFGLEAGSVEGLLFSPRDTEGSSRGESGGMGAKDGKERLPYELCVGTAFPFRR